MRLMSACAIAMSAAISAVVTPIHTTTVSDEVTPLIAPNEKCEAGAFTTTGPSIVKEQCAAAIVQPKHPEKKSHVANARSNERLFCSGRCTRSLDPEPDEQVRSEPD